MSWRILQFFKHFFGSNSRHGTHSPFVFELIRSCIYAREPKLPQAHHQVFSQLEKNQGEVEGRDHGAGSWKRQKIAERAKKSSVPRFQAELLFRLSSYFKPEVCAELGTNVGKSLTALALAHEGGRFIGVEGNEALSKIADEQLKRLNLLNAQIVHKSFDEWIAQNEQKLDMVFLDGDHHYEPTLRYVEQLLPMMSQRGVLIMHDIYWSPEMLAAWKKLQQRNATLVFIDLFFVGIICKGRPQAGQSFRVRFPPGWLLF